MTKTPDPRVQRFLDGIAKQFAVHITQISARVVGGDGSDTLRASVPSPLVTGADERRR